MGIMDWLWDKLKLTHVYVVEDRRIKIPSEGECLVFRFPKDTPREVIDEFDKRMVEFQNLGTRILSTNMELEIFQCKKAALRVMGAGGDNGKNSKIQRHSEHKRKGQDAQ